MDLGAMVVGTMALGARVLRLLPAPDAPEGAAMTDTTSGVAAPAAPLGALQLLRRRHFGFLYLIAAVVLVGVFGQTIARSWLAYTLTGSNAALGGVLLAFGCTMLVCTPFGGVAADRLAKRTVIRISLSLLVVTGVWIGLAVTFGVVAYWMLPAASVVQGVALALFNPARMSFIADLVPEQSVGRGVSLLLINAEANRVIGPALAGLVVGVVSVGTQAVFLAGATLAGAGLVLSVTLPSGRRDGAPPPRAPVADLLDGVAYVRSRPDLFALLWCGVLVGMIGMPYQAFLPAVAHDLFGAGSAGYGVLAASASVGAVATGLLLGRRRRPVAGRLFAGAGVLFGVALVAAALADRLTLEVLLLVVVGGALLAFQAANQGMLLSRSDPAYHGRIQGLVLLNYGAYGIASLPLGLLADRIGLRWTIGGMGVAVVAVLGVFLLVARRTTRPRTMP
jgi:MFS family permease